MDFGKLNTKADAERGSLLHFTHPQLGHKLYTGEGSDDYGRLIDSSKPHTAVTARVRGMESDHVRNQLRKGAAGAVVDPQNVDEAFGFAISLVMELNGVTDGDRAVSATPDGLKWFFGRSEDFAVQVINHARDRSNFFMAASQG